VITREITEEQLQDKIRAWIREYGPGGMNWGGTSNILAVLIDHKGFVPNSSACFGNARSVADEVHDAVDVMAQTPGCFRDAMALRNYYLTPNELSEEDRLHRLRIIGLPMSRATYFRCVQRARAFLINYFNAMRKELEEKNAAVHA
jgi:hypothetical protein